MRLLLARHGETDWNAAGRIQGRTDTDLNETGRAQARLLCQQLREHGAAITELYSSPQKRAMETALIVGREYCLTPVALEELRELSFGIWEGCSWTEVGAGWPAEYAAYRKDRLRHFPPEGESYQSLLARVVPVLDGLLRHGKGTALVVCHSAVIKSVLCHRDGGSFDRINQSYRLENAEWVEIESI